MTTVYSAVPLAELLVPHEDWLTADENKKYLEITVRLHGKGVCQRSAGHNPVKPGARRNRIKSGQFIASKIDARNGAFGIIPAELDGGVVSQDFPVFNIVDRKIIPFFLEWVTRTPQFVSICRQSSVGTTNRARLATEVFLQQPIYLPPLDEQRRIVEVLERAAGIRRLREDALAKARALLPALFLQTFGDPATNPKGWPRLCFGDLITYSRYGPRFHDRPYADNGARILRTSDIHFDGRVFWDAAPRISVTPQELARYALEPNTLLVTRTGATIGKVALFEGFSEPCIAGAYLIEFGLKRDCNPQYLLHFFRSDFGQEQIVRGGRAVAQPNINAPTIKALAVPLPPLALQRAFAERVAAVRGIIAQQERSLEAARALEQSLMARLLG